MKFQIKADMEAPDDATHLWVNILNLGGVIYYKYHDGGWWSWNGQWRYVGGMQPTGTMLISEVACPPDPVTIAEARDRLILWTMERHNGHQGRTARQLGIGVRTLYNHLKRLRAAATDEVEDVIEVIRDR